MENFVNGVTIVRNEYYLYSLMDTEGNIITPFIYNSLFILENDRVIVIINHNYVLIDYDGNKTGVIILDYLVEDFFQSIHDMLHKNILETDIIIVDQEGYYIHSHNNLGNNLINNDFILQNINPEVWQHVNNQHSSQLKISHDLYTFTRVNPFLGSGFNNIGTNSTIGSNNLTTSSETYYWTIISHVEAKDFSTISNLARVVFIKMFIILLLFAGGLSVFITKYRTDKKNRRLYIRQLAHYDYLTGLANRNFIMDIIDKTIVLAKRGTTKLGLLFIIKGSSSDI